MRFDNRELSCLILACSEYVSKVTLHQLYMTRVYTPTARMANRFGFDNNSNFFRNNLHIAAVSYFRIVLRNLRENHIKNKSTFWYIEPGVGAPFISRYNYSFIAPQQ